MPYVRAFTRSSDGVHVRGHWRNPPSGSSPGLGIAGFLAFVAVMVAIGHGAGHDSSTGLGSVVAAEVARTPQATSLGGGGRIVQVSSHRDAGLADAEAAGLRRRGLPAGVLVSGRYRPFPSGYYVVYVGPYPSTAAGRAAAARVASTLPGSLVRDVDPR